MENFQFTADPYPGTPLRIGSRGPNVTNMQQRLNTIANYHRSIPMLTVDGIFGGNMRESVVAFQKLLSLTVDGIIGEQTWNAIVQMSDQYTANPPANHDIFPGTSLEYGSSGDSVRHMQSHLNDISANYSCVRRQNIDGMFGNNMKNIVLEFQCCFGLTEDGIIGADTWDKIVVVRNNSAVDPPSEDEYPGTPLRWGSSGPHVAHMQIYLNFIGQYRKSIPQQTVDGKFGQNMYNAVMAFQTLYDLPRDGVIGENTWNAIVEEYNNHRTSPPPVDDVFFEPALQTGSSGARVTKMQNYLNFIGQYYPSIPKLTVDGQFGSKNQSAVMAFQNQFRLTADGEIGAATWDKIVGVYNNLQAQPIPDPDEYPGIPLRWGSSGPHVAHMQTYLNFIGQYLKSIPQQTVDGKFGQNMYNAVVAFQSLFGLTVDGVIGENTWDSIVSQYNIYSTSPPPAADVYAPPPLQYGSSGARVSHMQTYLNFIGQYYPNIPQQTVDGRFGNNTQNAVIAFQNQFNLNADGVIGPKTWDKIVVVYNNLNTNPRNPDDYPGTPLRWGSSGSSVSHMETYLNYIGQYLKSIKQQTVDGKFGQNMYNATVAFQTLFNLARDGVIGQVTWDKIVSVYHQYQLSPPPSYDTYPGYTLRMGSSGTKVAQLQTYLNQNGNRYPSIPKLVVDGKFGSKTQNAVTVFQSIARLSTDGVVGPQTWDKNVLTYRGEI